MFDLRDLDMLRVWMLLVVGVAAVRQVAEDASAHSAVKGDWNEKSLRSAVERLARERFPEEDREDLTRAVMKAFKSGELDKGLKGMSWQRYLFTTMQTMREEHLRREVRGVARISPWLTQAVMKAYQNGELDKGLKEKSREERQRYLLATMQQMSDLRRLRSQVEKVAKKRFPKKEREHLTEAMMEAFKNGKLDKDRMFYDSYLLRTTQDLRELPVAASAVKFCANLFREAVRAGQVKYGTLPDTAPSLNEDATLRQVRSRGREAEGICHKVLTGELGADDGPEWAEKAAKSSQPEGQHLKRGRLEHVNAVEPAWKVSLDNVCRDECHALVEEMRKEAREIVEDVGKAQEQSWKILDDVEGDEKPPSYEEVCAKHVVQKVEAEILGCCAEKCGWNGRACMYWPFLNSTEKGEWEAECCTEFNILKNSSRATMCDATLTRKENKEVMRDPQPNNEEERKMIGQDFVGKGTSFLQSEDTTISRPEGTCPDPLKLGKEHSKLKGEWKTTVSQFAIAKFFKFPACIKPPPKNDTIDEKCTAFLPQDVNGPYLCYGECLESVGVDGLPELQTINAKSTGNTGLLYVHETIYNRSGE